MKQPKSQSQSRKSFFYPWWHSSKFIRCIEVVIVLLCCLVRSDWPQHRRNMDIFELDFFKCTLAPFLPAVQGGRLPRDGGILINNNTDGRDFLATILFRSSWDNCRCYYTISALYFNPHSLSNYYLVTILKVLLVISCRIPANNILCIFMISTLHNLFTSPFYSLRPIWYNTPLSTTIKIPICCHIFFSSINQHSLCRITAFISTNTYIICHPNNTQTLF